MSASTSPNLLLKSPLSDWHQSHGGRMVDFAGWSMPVQYASIIDEHQATRTAIGLFDVSHMGRFLLTGPDAEGFLDSLTTRRIAGMGVGQIRYSLMTNEHGGILDDVLVYRLPRFKEGDFFAMVVNASNRNKIKEWLLRHAGEREIGFEDRTFDTGMIAVQGPRALDLVGSGCHAHPGQLKYYTGVRTVLFSHAALVSRTGYTGEDGCEVIAPTEAIVAIWERLVEQGASWGLRPAGLGARDTLRLEAAMPLYGHELSEQINAAQTGLDFAIQTRDRVFLGRPAIVAAAAAGGLPRRVGLEVEGRRAAREGSALLANGRPVGTVTSGTYSPTLQRAIAMAYVDPASAEPGTELRVDIRGTHAIARVVPMPFYRRPA